MYTNSWVEEEFEAAPFGDDRLNRRLMYLADTMFTKPCSSLPQVFESITDLTAAYRFFSNGRVKPEAITMTHREQTIERMKKHDTVLAIQDTTTIDFSGHLETEGLGIFGRSKTDYGFLCHTTLAVTPDGKPLGILDRNVWTRNPDEHGKRYYRNKRPTSEKESQKWLNALEQSLKDIPSYINVVTVCDREADFYDLFENAVLKEKNLLIRVGQTKRILKNGGLLLDVIKAKPCMGQFLTNVPRDPHDKHPSRDIYLSVKYCPIEVPAPRLQKSTSSLPKLDLYLVLAEESNPPEGVEPIQWLLLTTMPVENLDQAVEKIKWYKQRWKIERYHLVLKSGCKVEELQLESMESLQNALALYSVIAWKLLWLKCESEQNPETSCEIVLQKHEWQALYCISHQTPTPPSNPPTMEEAILMIAKLGGFLGRKNDGKPGVKVIWRGLMCLHFATQGWLAAHLPTPFQRCVEC